MGSQETRIRTTEPESPQNGASGYPPPSSPLDAASPSHTVKGTVPQSVRDALADAETLRLITLSVFAAADTDEAREMFRVLCQCAAARAHLHAGHVHMARQTYVAAAHHAFRAVPGLREVRP